MDVTGAFTSLALKYSLIAFVKIVLETLKFFVKGNKGILKNILKLSYLMPIIAIIFGSYFIFLRYNFASEICFGFYK